jgi:uncharacterized membrane protein
MTAPSARLAWLDAARGLAVVAMVAFHVVWDLANFGYIDPGAPYSPAMKLAGHAIASSFLFIAGVGLVLAHARAADWRPFLRRIGLVAGAAMLVTIGTYLAFPDAFVFFGILHLIAAASLLSAPLLLLPWPAAAIAALAAFAAPMFIASTAFDAPWLSWIGLSTFEPRTNDYQPLLPWSGVVFLGVAAGKVLGARARRVAVGSPKLEWLGRHSLALYLVHQPVLFGLFLALAHLNARPAEQAGNDFVAACVLQCEAGGVEKPICADACACTADRVKRAGLPSEAGARSARLQEIAAECLAERR